MFYASNFFLVSADPIECPGWYLVVDWFFNTAQEYHTLIPELRLELTPVLQVIGLKLVLAKAEVQKEKWARVVEAMHFRGYRGRYKIYVRVKSQSFSKDFVRWKIFESFADTGIADDFVFC